MEILIFLLIINKESLDVCELTINMNNSYIARMEDE